MNNYWSQFNQSIAQKMAMTQASNAAGEALEMEAGFQSLCAWTQAARDARRKIHFIGNGASATMASHMALDWSKNAGVQAVAYNDSASLTAIGNDFGYENVFSEPLSWFGNAGDLLATVSSSGNSPNILQAIAVGRQKGMRVITFSGIKPDNKSRQSGDLNFYVPAWTYGMVECAHHVLLHAWLDCYMQVREWELNQPQILILPAR